MNRELRNKLVDIMGKHDFSSVGEQNFRDLYDEFKEVVEEKKKAILDAYPQAKDTTRFDAMNQKMKSDFENMDIANMSNIEKRDWLFRTRINKFKKWIRLNRLGRVMKVIPIGYDEYEVNVTFKYTNLIWYINDPIEMLYSMQTFGIMDENARNGLCVGEHVTDYPVDTPAARDAIYNALHDNYDVRILNIETHRENDKSFIDSYRFVIRLQDLIRCRNVYVFPMEDNLSGNKELKRRVSFSVMINTLDLLERDDEDIAIVFDELDDALFLVEYMLCINTSRSKYMEKAEICRKAAFEYIEAIYDQNREMMESLNDLETPVIYVKRHKNEQDQVPKDFPFYLSVIDGAETKGKTVMCFKPNGKRLPQGSKWDVDDCWVKMTCNNIKLIEQAYPNMRISDMKIEDVRDHAVISSLTLTTK